MGDRVYVCFWPKADIASILGLLAFDLTFRWVGLPCHVLYDRVLLGEGGFEIGR